jgi:hypothetical protein
MGGTARPKCIENGGITLALCMHLMDKGKTSFVTSEPVQVPSHVLGMALCILYGNA